ncbi:MAG: glycosyltransferase, partial [Chryseobacterium sp.]
LRKPSFGQLSKEMLWADIIFENNPCVRMSWPNFLFRKPLITGLQTWIGGSNSKLGKADEFKKWWINRSDALIACSLAIKNQVSSRAVVIDNPYDDKTFVKLDIQKTIDFVFLGRLVSDKGASMAVKAFDLYRKRTNSLNSRLTIIGDGEEKNTLISEVKSLGLEDIVDFKGNMKGAELVQLLNRHRFMLVPSLWDEPFGIVVLEGMACGCIPIVSDGGGLPDAVGNAGLTFKKGDLNNMVDVMVKLKDSPGLESELKAASVTHLADHKVSVVAQRYLTVFEDVLNNLRD